jgi:hypothetical protein
LLKIFEKYVENYKLWTYNTFYKWYMF